MKTNNKYELAVFEDEDKADLVEYSEKMQQSIEKALDNNKGEKGDTGISLPEGGATGQILTKKSNTDDDVEWQDQIEIVDNLTSESVTSALSANQGRALNEKIEALESSDWVDLTLASGVTPNNDTKLGGKPGIRYRKQGTRVYIDGAVIVNFQGSSMTLTNLPSEIIPKYSYYVFSICSGARIARLYVNPNNNFNVEWIKNISDGSNYTGSTWLQAKIEYDVE